ncbi:MAG: hydroxymethylglutaryl-CoA lyase [Bdellovibrionales bacterium]|nr:hydroxymethylglutaryl-CoA lyase [Bdellovibrionales bacterium]
MIEIVEVGPRDGLQNEKRTLTPEQRFEFIKHLSASGLKRIEVGAFVSPKWVPQMEGSLQLVTEIYRRRDEFAKTVQFSALVPNVKGMLDALTTPLKEVAIFGACTESFSKKNINCTIAESFERFEQVIAMARKHKRKVRAYLSVAFGCPYEGAVPEKRVIDLILKLAKLGVHEISIGDTIGVATPKQVRSLLKKLKSRLPLTKVAMHFHDTRGTALANVLASLEAGVEVFDSSFGGLGGCPYAKGASGNLATDDLVYMLEGMGLKTGVDLNKLLSYSARMQEEIGHKLPSRTAEAGVPRLVT